MEQVQQDRIRVQGGVDAIKEILDQVIQEKMNLKGQLYVLTAENSELKQKLQALEVKKEDETLPKV
jgi:predicted nuclease with TOPRIM domain